MQNGKLILCLHYRLVELSGWIGDLQELKQLPLPLNWFCSTRVQTSFLLFQYLSDISNNNTNNTYICYKKLPTHSMKTLKILAISHVSQRSAGSERHQSGRRWPARLLVSLCRSGCVLCKWQISCRWSQAQRSSSVLERKAVTNISHCMCVAVKSE